MTKSVVICDTAVGNSDKPLINEGSPVEKKNYDCIKINGEDSKVLNIVKGTVFSFPTGLRRPTIYYARTWDSVFSTLDVIHPSG